MSVAEQRRPGRSSTWQRGYGQAHQDLRRRLAPLVAAGLAECARCGERIDPADEWDLGHVDGDRTRYAGPEHAACNRATTGRQLWRQRIPELEPERDGLPASDERWQVPWLKGLRRPPAEAVWPRLMTVPPPGAVDS